MGQNLENVKYVIEELNLTNEFKLLSYEENRRLFERLEGRFINKKDLRYWWEKFKLPYKVYEEIERPWEIINSFIPEGNSKVFLMIDDDSEIYPIFYCKSALISDVINECYWFEYYIVSEKEEWLICENHHTAIFVTGSLINIEKET